VVARFVAWCFFAEAVGPAQWIGGAIVLAGIWIAKTAS
jgi:drug/metabolite transporter (DMT)-like permease